MGNTTLVVFLTVFSFEILMISLWFKIKLRFGFCHRLLLKLSRVRGKRSKKKKHDIGAIFSNLWKFRNKFWYQLRQKFLIHCQ